MNARALHLQNVVAQPSNDEWTSLVERLSTLESAFNQLVSSAASKVDVHSLKTAIDVPMTELVKTVSRHERKHDLIRASAQAKFRELSAQLSELDRDSLAHETMLDALSSQIEEARARYMDDRRHEHWIRLILFGSASCSPNPIDARALLKSALHILFLPVTAPWQVSTLLLRYAGRRLFLPAPPHCGSERQSASFPSSRTAQRNGNVAPAQIRSKAYSNELI